MEKKWYIVHTYSGFEAKVKFAMEENIRQAGKEDSFRRDTCSYREGSGDGKG